MPGPRFSSNPARRKSSNLARATTNSNRTSIGMIRVLNLLFPETGPGGYFRGGSVVPTLDDLSQGYMLVNQIARTQMRAWIEKELGPEFGLNRSGLNPSLQIEFKPNRPLPNASLKWNEVTNGTTDPLQIEEATIRYLKDRLPGWGNNRSPNNDYVSGSTLSRGFETPLKTVYFDHLSSNGDVPTANEAYTGPAPGVRDVDAWIMLAKNGVVKPGMIIDFQNAIGQSISESVTAELASAGYQVSVVPFSWWSSCLNLSSSDTRQD